MKTRESGMPEEELWEQFFNVDKILNELEINDEIKVLVDFGFGYGTFTIPASKKIKGNVFAYDIESALVHKLDAKLNKEKIENVYLVNGDFLTRGTGLNDGEVDYVMLFNILHAEESAEILTETFRILRKNGKVGVIHWRYDPSTPRGPSMAIRPKPEDLRNMLEKSGFTILKFNINLPPYHYGILAQKQ